MNTTTETSEFYVAPCQKTGSKTEFEAMLRLSEAEQVSLAVVLAAALEAAEAANGFESAPGSHHDTLRILSARVRAMRFGSKTWNRR